MLENKVEDKVIKVNFEKNILGEARMPDYRYKQDSSDNVVSFDAKKISPAKDNTNQLQGNLPPSLTATAAREAAEKVSERLNKLPLVQQKALMKALYTGDLSSPEVQKILRSLRTRNISL